MSRLHHLPLAFLLTAAGAAAPAHAQSYPVKPVRMIVGFTVGGVTDIMARIVSQKLGERLGHQFIVDNRPGAGTGIAAEITARSAPDGYTLMMIGTSYAVNAGMQKTLPFDPVKDFSAIVLVSTAPQVLVASTTLPAKNVAELLELARARPGQINFASSSVGSASHLAGELLNSLAHVKLIHVPYKGGSSAMITDVIAGRMDLMFLALPGLLPQIRAGRVRAMAVTSLKRSPVAPEIPTFMESGVAGYEATSWNGLVAPAGTPAAVITKLNAEVLSALRTADVVDAMRRQGAEPLGSTPAEFDAYLRAEITKWKKVVAASGMQND